MGISQQQVRDRFRRFWEKKAHKEVPPIPLIPKDDPTTLFTGSGMQQLVPYLLGEPHPLGTKLYNIQPCFRAQDIEEIGDNRHTTFFEMMGNWSLGDYFKEEQLAWVWQFFTEELDLPKEKLHVSVFEGTKQIRSDEESAFIWRKLGLPKDKIHFYGADKNWWSRAGVPDNMPAGEPGGPDSEVFYDFGEELKTHEKSAFQNQPCHPNCDCGRFLEIGNSVFMQYKKEEDGSFTDLPKKNVDFGGGLERILAAINNNQDVFATDLFRPLLKTIKEITSSRYYYGQHIWINKYFRIMADHIKGSIMLINEGANPSNKERGYITRRLIRRVIGYGRNYLQVNRAFVGELVEPVVQIYGDVYPELIENKQQIEKVLVEEENNFIKTLQKGINQIKKDFQKSSNSKNRIIKGEKAFYYYETFGITPDLTKDIVEGLGGQRNQSYEVDFIDAKRKHQEQSRTSSAGMFKGGLANQSEQALKYHTATHLLHQALFDVLGNDVRQEGSNITGERLRFDFSSAKKPTPNEIKKIEDIINAKIKDSLLIDFKIMTRDEAYKIGAKSFFREKYPDMVKVYFIGADASLEHAYSKEFCGGPHVKNTSEIETLAIFKLEKIGSNIYRLYAR
ncbi:alanine--tRNA ligase [Candidatus Roizmanbacteria bacterium]|nr:alanine--tRNA ligase [Candidatus Roizmanbacteria bacterium]